VGWEKLTSLSQWANIEINNVGHFTTTYNYCAHEGDGVLNTNLWNTIAKDVNAAVQDGFLEEPVCTAASEQAQKMDGYVDVVLSPSKKTVRIFESQWGGQICSPIKKAALSKELIDTLGLAIVAVQSEDCAHPLR
jgi:hypothetical protein